MMPPRSYAVRSWWVYRELSTGRYLAGTLDRTRWVNLVGDARRFSDAERTALGPWRDWWAMADCPPVFENGPEEPLDRALCGVEKVCTEAIERMIVTFRN